jgi:hypothetical protein
MSTSHAITDWQNPQVLGINKRKAHAQLRSFTSDEQAFQHFQLRSEGPASPNVHSLNGDKWRFSLFDKPAAVPLGFENDAFDDGAWSEVRNRFSRWITDWPVAAKLGSWWCLTATAAVPVTQALARRLHAGYGASQLGVPGFWKATIPQLPVPIPH